MATEVSDCDPYTIAIECADGKPEADKIGRRIGAAVEKFLIKNDVRNYELERQRERRFDEANPREIKYGRGIALATAAAPTYFRPHRDGGYTFVDGGVWANNPTMIGVTEALTSFNVCRARVRVLSLGCGDDPDRGSGSKSLTGG